VKIDDSKRLTREQREIAEKWIIENSLTWGIGESSVSEINKLGIIGATNRAYRRAIYSITGHNIDHLLIDGFAVPRAVGFPKKRQTAIIRGDQKSFSIAAASIIAKVYRDNLMKKLSGHYKHYHWHSNVGYGTKVHRDAIIKHGVTAHHRELFVRNFT
jgi:ribonuclease HII